MAGQMMAVREKMGLTVRELLLAEEMKDIKVLAGDRGLDKEIKGVTIIEAPDIVKFIDGGEVLLTGLYAFRSCTVDDFRTYINELSRKSVSALVLKRGRKVENADTKMNCCSRLPRNITFRFWRCRSRFPSGMS